MEFWIGAFFITVLVIGASMLAFLLIDSFKLWVKIKYYRVKAYMITTREKVLLLKRIWSEIYRTYTSHSIEMLLQSYVYFYEKNYHDLEGWGYVDGEYTKNELMEIYKWIKQTRPKNFEELIR
jgi:hypothetical protein